MKLDKKTLRRLIKDELSRAVEAQRFEEAAGGVGYQAQYASQGGGTETALPTDQLMALIGAGFDMQGVNQTNLTPEMIGALRSAGFFLGEAAGAGYWSGQFHSDSSRGDALETGQLMQLQMILDGRTMGPNYMDIARKVNAKNLADMVNRLAAWEGRGAEVAAAVLGGANATSLGGGKGDPAGGLSKPLRTEADMSAGALARLARQKELEAGGMGHVQAKRVPAAQEADDDLAALWAWVQKNAPRVASSAMEALRGGAGSGEHWTGGLNIGSPESESDAGVFPEGVSSLTDLLDESIDLVRAQQVETKLKGLGMDEKMAWTVTNDLLNAAAGYGDAATKSGMLTDDMIAEISAAGDVSDEMLQQIATGGKAGEEGDDWETAWTKYSGSPAGTQSALSAGEDS